MAWGDDNEFEFHQTESVTARRAKNGAPRHGSHMRSNVPVNNGQPEQIPLVGAGDAVKMNPYLSGKDKRSKRPIRGGGEYLSGARRQEPKKKRRGSTIFALLFILALVGGGAWFWFTQRPVEITVNGLRRSVRIGTTLAEIVHEDGDPYTPGNYVDVAGEVLTEGKGTPYSASIGEEKLEGDQVTDYKVKGGESLTFDNGTDIMEEFSAEVAEVQPKLVSDDNYGSIIYVAQWGKVGKSERRTGKDSGKTVDTVVEEKQDCVIGHRNIEPADGRQLVALTFDDGPSAYTGKYLDILKEHNAKATFFTLGTELNDNPAMAQRVVDEGHQLGSHTKQHLQLTTVDGDTLRSELKSTFDDIKTATGVETTVFRPPYGDYNIDCWLNSDGLASAYILWNVDTEDWKRPGADAIASVASTATNGMVILMHDGGGDRAQDVEALPVLIENLQKSGYELVTINELLASDPTIPEDIATGNAKMPEGAVWPTELA